MTIEINLLPWREHLRERHRKRFYLALLLAALVGVAGGAGLTFLSQQQVVAQQQRNDRIQRQMARLESTIHSIGEYEEMREHILERIEAFGRLQYGRTQTVHLFNHLAENLEPGVHYTHLSRRGDTVRLVGVAESNHQVSDQLRALAQGAVLGVPVLSEVETEMDPRYRRFSLSVVQLSPASGEEP